MRQCTMNWGIQMHQQLGDYVQKNRKGGLTRGINVSLKSRNKLRLHYWNKDTR
jgi:hypothetical protein